MTTLEDSKVTFKHWAELQRSLKYNQLRLSHGNLQIDEEEKEKLLNNLYNLHEEYYTH